MHEVERQRLIQQFVHERSIISVAELVQILGASEATVRRDINAMAERGELRRIRGGAEALAPRRQAHLVGRPFQLSQGIRVAQKRAIARAAAALIGSDESIIINGGTTTLALVEFLPLRDLDILTNSIPIVTQLLASSRHRIVMPGGTIYREQSIVLSPYGNDATEHFWAQKLFTGCYGINRFGLMEADPLVAQAETRLLKRAEEVVVLADSSKLSQRSSMIVASLESIATLVTDDGACEEELAVFRDAGINVITATVAADAAQEAIASA